MKRALTAAALAVALLGGATPLLAQEDPNDPDEVDRECIMACRDSDRDCRFDVREAFKLCLEENGCNTLAADYRAACLVEDRDEEACAAARVALRECRMPCREAASSGNEECRTAFITCLQEQCGIDELPHPGHHHGRRPGPGFGGHRGHH
jgi:hypothetical protein